MGSKEIGERVQYSIDDMHHGQRSIPKGLSKTCQYPSNIKKSFLARVIQSLTMSMHSNYGKVVRFSRIFKMR
jgi:hypothetical protein